MNEAEKKFEAENGMSSAEAWNFVLQWKKEGKNQEAQNGCEEILRYFPDHQEARMMLTKIEKETEDAHIYPIPAIEKKKRRLPMVLQNMIKKVSPPQEVLPGMEPPRDDERFWGAFSYAYFLVFIPLLLRRDSDFVQHHALQGVILAICSFVCFQILVPFFSLLGLGIIMYVIGALLMILHMFSLFQAFSGSWFRIPIIYEFSQKLKSYL